MEKHKGWKPIPISLKILFIILILWVIGSAIGLPTRYESGLPFFGIFVYGLTASLIVLILDIIAPITFLIALWNRKSWGAKFALVYISIFLINGIFALFIFSEQLGLIQILIPNIANIIFFVLIYRKRDYFEKR